MNLMLPKCNQIAYDEECLSSSTFFCGLVNFEMHSVRAPAELNPTSILSEFQRSSVNDQAATRAININKETVRTIANEDSGKRKLLSLIHI